MRKGLIAGAFAICLALPAAASAYTVVLRGGERVDVGASYRVVGSALEYTMPSGEVRRLALQRIDMAATARENRETVDAFLDRGAAPPAPSPRPRRVTAPPPAVEQAQTVTNADLEAYRVERERADAEYHRTHPDSIPLLTVSRPAPSRAYDAARADDAEWRWRSEAQRLRDRLDAEQSQIDAIQSEIAYRDANPFKYGLSYDYNYPGTPVVSGPGGGYYGYSSYPDYVTVVPRAEQERGQLASRLIDLQIQHRATLAAWDSFAERARRAGVPPGWLRE
jgi:hypothetical protein